MRILTYLNQKVGNPIFFYMNIEDHYFIDDEIKILEYK